MCVQSIGNTTMVPPLPIPSTFPLHFPPAKLTFLIQICKHFQESFTKRKKISPKMASAISGPIFKSYISFSGGGFCGR